MVYLFLWTRNLVYTDETKIGKYSIKRSAKKFCLLKKTCNCFLVGLPAHKIKEKTSYLAIKKHRGSYMLLFCYKIMLHFQFFISKVFCVILYSCHKVL